MQIVQDLQMGLSTVSQNLNLLEKEGLIDRNGYFDSTGGRKAQAIQYRLGFPDFHWNRDPEKTCSISQQSTYMEMPFIQKPLLFPIPTQKNITDS